MPIVLHVGVQINAVVDLAAALADEGQRQTVEEARAAADVGGGFQAGEVATGRLGCRSRSWRLGLRQPLRRGRSGCREIQRELHRLVGRFDGLGGRSFAVCHLRCVGAARFIGAFSSSTMASAALATHPEFRPQNWAIPIHAFGGGRGARSGNCAVAL